MKQVHKSYPLTLAVGKTSLKERITLEPGTVVGGFIVIEDKTKLTDGEFTNVGIKSMGNSDLVDPVDVRAWEQRSGGSYLDSLKQFFFSEKEVNVIIETGTTQAAAVNLQLVLIFNQDECQ